MDKEKVNQSGQRNVSEKGMTEKILEEMGISQFTEGLEGQGKKFEL